MGEPLKSITAKVVGVTFKNEDGTKRQDIVSMLSIFDPVELEYFEYQDEPAYSVWTMDGEQIGHLAKGLAADIRQKYGNCSFDAHVEDVYGGDDGLNYGCRISMDIYSSPDDLPSAYLRSIPNLSSVSNTAHSTEPVSQVTQDVCQPKSIKLGNPTVSNSVYKISSVSGIVHSTEPVSSVTQDVHQPKSVKLGDPSVSNTIYKVCRTIYLILGIFALLIGFIALPVTIIFIFLSFFFFKMRKYYGIILKNRNLQN